MLTKLTIRNFKRFETAEIELGNPVVFVGPNNSGKTTALQALALWSTGLRLWNAKWSGKTAPANRPGVTVNRRDLVAVPVPSAKALWKALHVREVGKPGGRQRTSNVRVDIVVDGVTAGRSWTCGFEFDYANEESFYCRPLRVQAPAEADGAADWTATADAGASNRTPGGKAQGRMEVPKEAGAVSIAYLPPMSGLAATESRLDSGAVAVRIGEGRTAEVLRNLCHRVHEEAGGEATKWDALATKVERLFGARIPPVASLSWSRREIENYLCSPATLEAFAKSEARDEADGPLLAPAACKRRVGAMTAAVAEVENALATLDKSSPWDADAKVSDDFLVPLFVAYYKKLDLPNLMPKRNFHLLAEHVPPAEIDPEVVEKLDAIAETAAQADEALAEPTS